MSLAVTVLIVLVSVIRVTRLLVLDRIGEPLRRWVLSKSGEDGWVTFLIHCPWCTGYWVALPATGVLWKWTALPTLVDLPTILGFLGAWATIAYLTGFTLTRFEDR